MYFKELTSRRTGSLPVIVRTQSELHQSRFVVQKILEFREEEIPLEEMAVLFRSGFLSDALEIELMKANIPFVKYGGFKFIETSHIKDLIAHLRVLVNPHDVISWNRILLLIDGIGPKKAESIIEEILAKRLTPQQPSDSFWKSFHSYPKGLEKLFSFFTTASKTAQTVPEVVFYLIEYYKPLFKSKYDDHTKRMKDLDMFAAISEQYEQIESLLTDLALDPPVNSITDVRGSKEDEDLLVLSTVHSAKGLEWKTVFIINALDGRFPSQRAVDDQEDLEEELRLFYVACTRAKDHLIITYPMEVFEREFGVVLSKPSRFLSTIDDKQAEQWMVDGSLVDNPLLR